MESAARSRRGRTRSTGGRRDRLGQSYHAVSVVKPRPRSPKHDRAQPTGFHPLVAVLARSGVSEVAIERPDGPLVDALLAPGFTVVVISPNQLKNLRGRYGSAVNKDDPADSPPPKP